MTRRVDKYGHVSTSTPGELVLGFVVAAIVGLAIWAAIGWAVWSLVWS